MVGDTGLYCCVSANKAGTLPVVLGSSFLLDLLLLSFCHRNGELKEVLWGQSSGSELLSRHHFYSQVGCHHADKEKGLVSFWQDYLCQRHHWPSWFSVHLYPEAFGSACLGESTQSSLVSRIWTNRSIWWFWSQLWYHLVWRPGKRSEPSTLDSFRRDLGSVAWPEPSSRLVPVHWQGRWVDVDVHTQTRCAPFWHRKQREACPAQQNPRTNRLDTHFIMISLKNW